MKYLQVNTARVILISALALGPMAAQAADESMTNVDHSTMDHSTMDMDMPGMQMQGGSAPADARDPHAYSDGQTLNSGDYVLPGPRQIRMADEHNFAALLMDRLERVASSGQYSTAYDLKAWFGRDYNKLVIKAEGDIVHAEVEESRTEALWSHAVTAYWDTQLGLRHDGGADRQDRNWLAAGVQGLAPYWFEIDATAYVGNDSRTALRLQAEYELLFTQKLILQPSIEANMYGKSDPANGIGSGVSDLTVGMRLRYEIRREFAPYAGVEYTSTYGETADFARTAGADVSDTRVVAGLRFWY